MFKKIWSVITTIFVIFVFIVTVALVGVRILGYQPYAVMSGSMSPILNTGDLIYVKDIDPEDLSVGSIIAYRNPNADIVITHRVIEIDTENDRVMTKGDNNEDADMYQPRYSDIKGIVVFSIPLLGYISILLTSLAGKLILILIGTIILLGLLLPDLIGKKEAEEEDAANEEEPAAAPDTGFDGPEVEEALEPIEVPDLPDIAEVEVEPDLPEVEIDWDEILTK